MAALSREDIRALEKLAATSCIKYMKHRKIDPRWSQKPRRYVLVKLAKKKLCEETIETIEYIHNKKFFTSYVYTITPAGQEVLAAELLKKELSI